MIKIADTDKILWDTKDRAIKRNRIYILRMIVLGLVVFSLMIGAFSIFYSQTNRLLQQQSSFYLQEITTKSAERLKEKVYSDLRILEGLALFLGEFDELDVNRWLTVMQDSSLFSEFQRFGFMLPNGHMFTTEIQDVDFSSREYFKEIMQGKTTISDVFIDEIHQKRTLAYGAPVIHNQKVIGAIGFGLVTQEYEEILDISSFEGEGTLHLLDSNGMIIIKLGDSDIPKRLNLNNFQNDFKEGKSGIIRLEGQEKPRLLAYAPVGVEDWVLLLEIPSTFLLKSQQQTKLYAMLLTLGYGILMLFFSYYILIKRRRYDLSLLKLAYVDKITGIANSALFVKRAEILLKEKEYTYACVVLNIRNFKIIKDLFGYSYGDVLIKQIASMLPSFCSDNELYGREERDRFLLFLVLEGIEERVASLITTLNQITLPKTASFNLEIVAGICYVKEPYLSIPICIDRASLAVNQLHNNHEISYLVYTDTIKKHLLIESEMVKDFQEALEFNQFFVQLQPKFNLNTETIIGAEALVRWNHPTKGLLPPLEFIPIFEKHNLITDLDMFVLTKVCEKFQAWKAQGITLLPISVNQSRIHLKNPSYVADLVSLVDSFGIDHSLLEFELTENIFLGSLEYLKEVVFSLRKQGFFVSIDDFGSFYSSLNMLKNITVDYLKLDREFLMEAEDDIRRRKVLHGVIRLAYDLGILIIAEGVETKEQVEMLKELGCTIAQGFYYERPIAIESYEKLLLELP